MEPEAGMIMAAAEPRENAAPGRGRNGNGRAGLDRPAARPCVRGKFLWCDGRKLYVKGATYGTFAPDEAGSNYGDAETVARDFAAMRANGLNSVRTYTVPPRWLLDLAQQNELLVMVGLPWEQHVAFLDDSRVARSIEQRVREGVRSCAEHPALLGYAVGNEIPAGIARWHGRRPLERWIERLYNAAKDEDPGALVTYVNYPSTEYLELPFLDFVSFNVYLESQRSLEAYLARLHNRAGDLPLLMAEIGLDSQRHGEDEQARVLRWQVSTAFSSGCAGAFLFAWTDEWHRGGHEIEDWDFGLTTRDRRPKPALAAARDAFGAVPFAPDMDWPRVSVVVCTCNGGRTLGETLPALQRLEYPDCEVIVVSDGSTDASAELARAHGFRVIETENRGLSSARNTGVTAATGEIVAFIDDDAYPDPHWVHYLVAEFRAGGHVAVGGPNLPPPGDGVVADSVANAPGNPTHVLLSDRIAEHVPGCNMAVRRDALLDVGGFDPQFRIAGDDVDICWRLQEAGGTIGYSAAAIVWHHRRREIAAYWRQQTSYGRAEAMVEAKWPEKYNRAGHRPWAGRIYGNGHSRPLVRRQRIYHGTWGSNLFQSIYEPAAGTLATLPMMPEWYLVLSALAAISATGVVWAPLFAFVPALVVVAATLIIPAVQGAASARYPSEPMTRRARFLRRLLTTVLHFAQPVARLRGRLKQGLSPWRPRRSDRLHVPRARSSTHWSEQWRAAEERLAEIEADLIASGARVVRGGSFDRWDLEIHSGVLAWARLRMAIEEHGSGKQLVRLRSWPRASRLAVGLTVLVGGLAVAAAVDGAAIAASTLGAMTAFLLGGMLVQAMAASSFVRWAHRGGPARRRSRGRHSVTFTGAVGNDGLGHPRRNGASTPHAGEHPRPGQQREPSATSAPAPAEERP
jgi:GT2 family glycosyltransferase/membrane protein implicated in regulation of membrane protease activity